MNPGIYYLYEYQNKTRRRNVGFLKITRHYQSCIFQIHARGISVGNGGSLELWAFCLHGAEMTGTQIAALTCFNRTVSARLPVSESTFPENRSLFGIDGFLIRLPGGHPPVFWIASGQHFDADPASLREPAVSSPDEASESSSPSEEDTMTENLPEADDRVPVKDLPETAEDSLAETALEERCHSESGQDHSSARKIQRADLTCLPKKFWALANNSFLLHGYHNYGHLLLVEEENHTWLGVPGIYDPREARAAELFGFPQFTRSYTKELDLSEEERNDSADFGHWCRYLDTSKHPSG